MGHGPAARRWPASGNLAEQRIAPRFYRSSRIVTLSDSSRDEIVELLGLGSGQVTVAPPGVDDRYAPGGQRSATPLVVAVGRLVPVKRFDVPAPHAGGGRRRTTPTLQAVIIGEGYERPALEALRDELGAADWVSLPGRVDDAELGVVVPAGLGRGQQLTARGVGDDPDRGRSLWHSRRGHGDRGPCRCRARRRVGAARREHGRDGGRARAGAGRRGPAQPPGSGCAEPGALVHLGRHRAAVPSRRWQRKRPRRPRAERSARLGSARRRLGGGSEGGYGPQGLGDRLRDAFLVSPGAFCLVCCARIGRIARFGRGIRLGCGSRIGCIGCLGRKAAAAGTTAIIGIPSAVRAAAASTAIAVAVVVGTSRTVWTGLTACPGPPGPPTAQPLRPQAEGGDDAVGEEQRHADPDQVAGVHERPRPVGPGCVVVDLLAPDDVERAGDDEADRRPPWR